MFTIHNGENYRIDRISFGLGAVLMCNCFMNLECGIFGSNKVPGRDFTDAIWIDAGYSLDAPDVIPAGGMGTFTIADDPEPMGEQLLAHREGPTP